MENTEKRPQGCTFYRETLMMLRMISDENAGKAIKAAAAYYLDGEVVEFGEREEALRMVSILLRGDVDKSMERYRATCERRRRYRERDRLLPEEDEEVYILPDSINDRQR